MPKPAAKNTVWIVAHVEFMGCTTHPHRDTIVSHVASSRRGAITWIRRRTSDAWSWWEVFAFAPDCPSFERDDASSLPVMHLDAQGRTVQAPDIRAARAAFRRNRRSELRRGVLGDDEDRCRFCMRAAKRQGRGRP